LSGALKPRLSISGSYQHLYGPASNNPTISVSYDRGWSHGHSVAGMSILGVWTTCSLFRQDYSGHVLYGWFPSENHWTLVEKNTLVMMAT
jgi:hypothetical protein